jgi:hypothetical protein
MIGVICEGEPKFIVAGMEQAKRYFESRRGHLSTSKQSRNRRSRGGTVTWDIVRQLLLSLPGVKEGTSYGTPAFKVNGKLLARFHQDGESLVVKVDYAAREVLMGVNPQTFYITHHYRCWPLVLARISSVDLDDLRQLIEEGWRNSAPKRVVAAWKTRDER